MRRFLNGLFCFLGLITIFGLIYQAVPSVQNAVDELVQNVTEKLEDEEQTPSEEVEMIEFTVTYATADIEETFTCEKGMTWYEFLTSEYNTSSNFIFSPEYSAEGVAYFCGSSIELNYNSVITETLYNL